jgi:hypothetical protein
MVVDYEIISHAVLQRFETVRRHHNDHAAAAHSLRELKLILFLLYAVIDSNSASTQSNIVIDIILYIMRPVRVYILGHSSAILIRLNGFFFFF